MPKEMDILQIYMSNYLLWHSLKFSILLVLSKFKSSKNFSQVNYIHYGRGQLIRLIHLQRDLRNTKNGTSGIETSSKT